MAAVVECPKRQAEPCDHTESDAILARIVRAVAAGDAGSLLRLRAALGSQYSRYVALEQQTRESIAREIEGGLGSIGYVAPKPRRPRKPRARKPIPELLPGQLNLFGGTDRLPRRPYCTSDLEYGLRIRSLASALNRPYLQINPPHLRVWTIFEVDREGGALAWEDAHLPPPAWASVNRENGHAHLVWGLSAPVLVDSPDMRQAPLRYLCSIEAAFREKMQADSGYSGLITKNPLHPLWRVLHGPQRVWNLSELAEYVDLPKHLPRRKPEEVGIGRNVTLFDWLRQHAYREIRHCKAARNFVIWQAHLNGQALMRNGDFQQPLDGCEVWAIVKSVSKWTWRRFDLADSDRRFSALQAHRGRHGGIARSEGYEAQRADARIMRASGMTLQAIADELGVHVNSVSAWCRD